MGSFDAELDRARQAYIRRDWADAHGLFLDLDSRSPLAPPDLEMLAWSATLTGHDDMLVAALERLHNLGLEAGKSEDASRAAFWIGFRFMSLGEFGRGGGWLQRAQRLLDGVGRNCVVEGYMLLPSIHQKLAQGDLAAAISMSAQAASIGERFGDRDLVAFARNLEGRALIRDGRVPEGLALLDEAMLAASDGELSPFITGLVYCSVIATCCQIYAIDRAREWTEALAAWCDSQPQLAAFGGTCMVHRSEILQINGAWPEAIAEARDAAHRLDVNVDRSAAAAAHYQQGEIHRLRGGFAAAEKSYREASRIGREPQPGLALLRLAQGRTDQAAAGIAQATGATEDPLELARLLPAYIEIMLATGAHANAVEGCRRLGTIAKLYGTELLAAMAAHSHGAVALSGGDPSSALAPLREALSIWQRADAPYIAARIRTLIAQACQALGDEDGAALERDAARAVFEELGAAPDIEALGVAGDQSGHAASGGLTAREIEVLRLVAGGQTNREIAAELGLSAKTVDRHLGNIFNKLDVSSRAAATAWGYRQRLI